MLELIVFIYAMSYVILEFVWLKSDKLSFIEDVFHPINWLNISRSFFTTAVLVFLPLYAILFLSDLIYHKGYKYVSARKNSKR